MTAKLSDSEFARRQREQNRQRSQRQRARFKNSGQVVMTIWIPQELRDWVAGNVESRDESLSETVTKILAEAKRQQNAPAPEAPTAKAEPEKAANPAKALTGFASKEERDAIRATGNG